MNKILKLFLSLLALSFVMLGCVKKEEVESLEDEIRDYELELKDVTAELVRLKEQIASLEGQAKEKEEERRRNEQEMEEFIDGLSEAELKSLLEGLWFYQVRVNEEDVNEDGLVKLESDTAHVTFTEKQLPYSFLPEDLYAEGQMTTSYIKHVITSYPNPDETSGRDGTLVTTYELIYKDLEIGDEIKIAITDDLRRRLGLLETEILIKREE